MSAGGLHEILILSGDMKDCKLLLCAVVEKLVNGFVVLDNRSVLVNMRERGSELLLSGDDISEDMFAGKRAARFSVAVADGQPENVPSEAEFSISSGSEYYGRVRLCCTDGNIPDDRHIDAVIIAAGHDSALELPQLPPETGIAAAVPFDKQLPENIEKAAVGRRFFCGRYDPFGFVNGVRLRPDCAEPYGIEELFWHAVRFASSSRYAYLNGIISAGVKTIKRRSGRFASDSIRSYMELESARAEYSRAVRDIYSSERLLELTRGYVEEKK